jgi:Abnormal spindle-like microcephaly-assoc'd, ASPM-SPD-2-Hydin/Right handed beta helix region
VSPKSIGFQVCLLVLFSALPSPCGAQATVNESLETAAIYVDGNTGSDSNPGTQSQPLKTISAAANKALSNNDSGVGSRVIINPGTYRESVAVGNTHHSTSLPITFQAATSGTVVISGADVWTGWIPYSGNSNIYTQSWPYNWGLCPPPAIQPPPQDIVLRQEMVIVTGTPLTEVLSLTAMMPGTFFPDEANATVYVWPPAGTNMTTAKVEVATRPTLFSDYAQSNVVLRGLTFEYANACHGNAAVSIIGGANNFLVDTDAFLWNNAIGLEFNNAQNFTVRSSVANHNGQTGLYASHVKYALFESNVANYNNWRGAQGAYYNWDTGGGKFLLTHTGTFENFTALFNQTHPIHFDTDNTNITVKSLIAVGNVQGFLMEKSEGPGTITGSYFCGNGLISDNQGGLVFRDSTSFTVTANNFYGNGVAQIGLVGVVGGIAITNWETGLTYQLLNSGLTFQQNIVSTPSAVPVFRDSYLGGSDWTVFASTLSSDNNTWWANTYPNAFTLPTPRSGSVSNLSGWQSLTGQDGHSSWASGSRPAQCNVQSQGADYWLLSNNTSPVTASPSGRAAFSLTTVPLGGMTGTVKLSVDGVSAIPGVTASFAPPSIGTSASTVLTLTTSPATPAGTYPFTILGNSGSVTHTVTASVTVPQTSVRLSTTSLAFAGQPDGTAGSPMTLKLTNTGKIALPISGISTTSGFAQTNTCGIAVNAGGSCTFSVTFSPTQVKSYTGRLTIKDADTTSPQLVALSGTGLAAPDVSVSPSSLNFWSHKIGTTTTDPVVLNNRGTGSLTLNKITISGTNLADFSQSNNCGSSLPASATCTINVVFKPSASGTRSGLLSIYDNDNDGPNPQTVSLSGTGVK